MSGSLSYSEAAALMLIYRGLSTVKQLASALRVSVDEASRIISSLEARGLVERVRGFLGREKLRLTRKGLDSIPEASEVLKKAIEAATKAAEDAKAGARPVIDEEILAALPALMFLGLVPAWVLGALLPLMTPTLGYGSGWETSDDQELDYDDVEGDFVDSDF